MTSYRSFLFLVLSGTLIATTAFGAPVVHIISALPKNSDPAQVQCSATNTNLGVHLLKVGEDYSWTAEANVVNYCQAQWGRFIASWHAFEPTRDASHGTVYWLVKEDGFSRSWDNTNWVKAQAWETE